MYSTYILPHQRNQFSAADYTCMYSIWSIQPKRQQTSRRRQPANLDNINSATTIK